MMKSLSTSSRAYALLDVVLAVALFSIAMTGLLSVMQRINETSGEFARDRFIQGQLESMLLEKKSLPVGQIVSELYDPVLDCTFRSYVEAFEVDNGEGAALTDLYKLTVEAAFRDSGGEQVEKAELIIYQPET